MAWFARAGIELYETFCATLTNYSIPPLRGPSRFPRIKTLDDEIWVDEGGAPYITSFFFGGFVYEAQDAMTGEILTEHDVEICLRRSEIGRGTYGRVHAFVRCGHLLGYGGIANCDPPPPQNIALKISRSECEHMIERECRDTGFLTRSCDSKTILSSKPLNIVATDQHIHMNRYMKSEGVFVSYTVSPRMRSDLYIFLCNPENRMHMENAGELVFLYMLRDILRGMQHLQELGLCYADLKLSNVLLGEYVAHTPSIRRWILGDIGGICEYKDVPTSSTFPSPFHSKLTGAVDVHWGVAVFILEYMACIQNSKHKQRLYASLCFSETSLSMNRERVDFMLGEMLFLGDNLTKPWPRVRELWKLCVRTKKIARQEDSTYRHILQMLHALAGGMRDIWS